MARPKKAGLDYFPFDCNFFADIKIKVLLLKFGFEGVILYIYLLCRIYERGYYLEFNRLLIDAIIVDLKIDEDLVMRIIKFFTDRDLFDKNIFIKKRVITSKALQYRFQSAKKHGRREMYVNSEFWLLNKNETFEYIKPLSDVDSVITADGFCGKNSEKERKENKSKLNYISKAESGTKSYGKYKNVLLTDDEMADLRKKYSDIDKRIEYLDLKIEQMGYKYKSHYLTIIDWAKRSGTLDSDMNKPSYSMEAIMKKVNNFEDIEGVKNHDRK